MVIPHAEIHTIVEGLSERELHNPEGAGVDFRLGEVHRLKSGKAFIDADIGETQGQRSMFDTELIISYDPDATDQSRIIIQPGDYFLVKTIEAVDTPLDVMGDIRPRSTLYRSGLALFTGFDPPGYHGQFIFGLTNLGPMPVTLQAGARICSVVFYRLEAEGVAYRGQHMGGRVTSAGKERQV